MPQPTFDEIELITSEYIALHEFYDATNGPDWQVIFGEPWNFSSYANPCTEGWGGIECGIYSNGSTGSQYSITQLFLVDFNLSGTIPDSIGEFTHLQYLYLAGNKLSSNIPSTIGDLSELTTLMVDDNFLTGTIPDSFGNLGNLTELYLFQNYLSGPIPDSISNLELLNSLIVRNNRLTGTIPNNIGSLVSLTDFDISNNLLSGDIPPTIGNLGNLYFMMCQNNRLSGALPASMADLIQLIDFGCSNNHLSGQLPGMIGNYTYVIRLDQNRFSGTIPVTFGRLQTLSIVNLTKNALMGPIPASIANIIYLSELYIAGNLLSGIIPPLLGNTLLQLTNLDLSSNTISGSIPCSLAEMVSIEQLNLGSNRLNGTLPSCFTQVQPGSLILKNNRLTGTLPANLTGINFLDLSNNQLTGTLPSALPEILTYLYLNGNQLTGSLPKTLGYLTYVVGIDFRNNRLSGTLDGVFNGSRTPSLATLQFDNNPFTGTLPSDLFDIPALTTLTVVNSCFQGSLPSNLCSARQLKTLILFGLSAGKTCTGRNNRMLGGKAVDTFQSHLDQCVLELPQIVSMILSANSLTGHFTNSLNLSDQFLELELAHNLLSGTIPPTLQNKAWFKLDLSHNKLVGTLDSNLFGWWNSSVQTSSTQVNVLLSNDSIADNSRRSLSLDNNRLAGSIPQSLRNMRVVNVLAGNLFECSTVTKAQLPDSDPDYSNYECASTSFDYAYYAWLGLVVVSICAGYVIWRHALVAQLSIVIQVPDQFAKSLTNVFTTLETFQQLLKWSFICTVYIILVLTPYYAIISHYAGTHSQQYAYTVSIIFSSGIAPFVLNILFWGILLVVFFAGLFSERQNQRQMGVFTPLSELLSTENRALAYITLLYGAGNIILVTGVNVLFMWIKLTQSTQLQQFSQVALAAFKIGSLSGLLKPIKEGPVPPRRWLQPLFDANGLLLLR
eukprot:gene10604-12382_t